jgi:hypothetical protein
MAKESLDITNLIYILRFRVVWRLGCVTNTFARTLPGSVIGWGGVTQVKMASGEKCLLSREIPVDTMMVAGCSAFCNYVYRE